VLPALFPVQLKQYLALSDDQVARIGNVSQQVYTLEASKIQRQAQLQIEIAQETAKPVPDPTALGTRYAELESIRRDLDALQKNLTQQLQAVLGADQKAKLATLQQALSLYSTACSAVSINLLTPPTTFVVDPSRTVSATLAALNLGVCGSTGSLAFLGLPSPQVTAQP